LLVMETRRADGAVDLWAVGIGSDQVDKFCKSEIIDEIVASDPDVLNHLFTKGDVVPFCCEPALEVGTEISPVNWCSTNWSVSQVKANVVEGEFNNVQGTNVDPVSNDVDEQLGIASNPQVIESDHGVSTGGGEVSRWDTCEWTAVNVASWTIDSFDVGLEIWHMHVESEGQGDDNDSDVDGGSGMTSHISSLVVISHEKFEEGWEGKVQCVRYKISGVWGRLWALRRVVPVVDVLHGDGHGGAHKGQNESYGQLHF